MFRIFGPAVQRRAGVIAIGAISVLLMSGTAHAQAPAPSPRFPGGAGLVLNVVKADKTADWEAVIGKIVEGLQKPAKTRTKSTGLRLEDLQSSERRCPMSHPVLLGAGGAPPDADFSRLKILARTVPNEAVAIYKEYSDCTCVGAADLSTDACERLRQVKNIPAGWQKLNEFTSAIL